MPMRNHLRSRHWGLRLSCLALMLALSFALACGGDHLNPTPLAKPEELFWNLELNVHAVTLTTPANPLYDTLTLAATARNYAGDVLAEVSAPQYTTSDESKVLVTSEGTLVAVAPTPPGQSVIVITTLTVDGVTHQDRVFVKVVANTAPPVLASLSIHPVPPDSAKRSLYDQSTVDAVYKIDFAGLLLPPARATDADGQPMTDLVVAFSVSDPSIASFATSFNYDDPVGQGFQIPFIANRIGEVTFYASATAFGVTKVDTLPYQIGWPLGQVMVVNSLANLGPGNFFTTSNGRQITEITIGAGGFVGWRTTNNFFGTPTPLETDIVFDEPTNVRPLDTASQLMNPDYYPDMCNGPGLFGTVDGCSTGGNFVLPANEKAAAYRVFPVPGVYEYQNALNGARGRVVVMP